MHFLRLHGSEFLVEATNTLIDMYLDTVDQPMNSNLFVCTFTDCFGCFQIPVLSHSLLIVCTMVIQQ